MKKLIAFLLAVIMIASVVPFTVSAEAPKTVYGGESLEVTVKMTSDFKYEMKEDGYKYIHYTATAGEYGNGNYVLNFTPTEVSLFDYPYIAVRYRTNSTRAFDVNMIKSGKESNPANKYTTVSNDMWQTLIVDLNEMTKGAGLAEATDKVSLRIKPFGAHDKIIIDGAYVDLMYMACFKTAQEAEKFVYSGEGTPVTGEVSVTKAPDAINKTEAAESENKSESASSAVSGQPYDIKHVFGGESLEYVGTCSTDFQYEILEEDGKKYIHYTCEPGTYDNSGIHTTFTPEGFSLYDYPYVRIHYRTNSHKNFSMNMYSKKGESWMSKNPTTTGDGTWRDVILTVNDMIGGKGPLGASEIGVYLMIKPFGAHEKTLPQPGYVDYMYIACFRTLEDAQAFVYTGETDPVGSGVEITETPYYYADEAYLAELNAMTDARIEAIKNSPTEVTVTGTKYYVAANGDDADDGLTPETAWQTINKVNSVKFNEGDGVFFKRGDSFRTTVPLKSHGITLSAYGSGAKPKIIASVDASGADKWLETEYENVWVYSDVLDASSRDVGTIVFDGGRAWGIKVSWTKGDIRVDNGLVSNGKDEPYEVDDPEFIDHRDLQGNLEFYHSWFDDHLYLYCKDGNPGDVFTSIEIVDNGHGISMGSNTVIDNLEVFGAGSHGIGGGTVKNVLVQNCVLSWIGGSIQGDSGPGNTTRYGNAVESYGSSDNFTIRNCYATQVYDCCWTAQIQGPGTFNNIKFYGNVAEYSNTGLEVWQEGGTISNMDLYDNITRYDGYGWSHQRPNKGGDIFKNDKPGTPYNDGNFFYGGFGGASTKFVNNHVRNNINFITASTGHALRATGTEQYNFHDNIYVNSTDKNIGSIAANPGRGSGALWWPKFTEENVLKAVKTGFEQGSKFYWVEPEREVRMYDPNNGVNVFDDIADNFWGREYIDFVTLKGLFNGVSETEFSPNGTMTRAMLVTVLGRLSGDSISRAKNVSFTDVNLGAWYAPYVQWAEEKGLVDAGASFRPDDKATREELADMLYRYAKSEYKAGDVSGVAMSFSDAASVDAKYANGIKFCTSNGIIGGYEDGSVKPKNSATRTEVSAMIERFVSYLTHTEADGELAYQNAKKIEFKGAELRKIVDVKSVRAQVVGDTVEFTPFTATGSPVINLYDYLSKDIRFVEYPAILVKYSTTVDSDVSAELMYKTSASFQMKTTGVAGSSSKESGYMLFDCTPYYSTISLAAYNDDCGLAIYPWGSEEVTFGEGEKFVIESVTFFDSVSAADRYAKTGA
ncbi:MAG: S-layer homology domain-containing protein [Clostridia bacterium]|nr:S-layer homology domain-containing protein [Clostridia bacterium]